MTVCLHCNGICRLTTGGEIYPHRPDLADRPIWKCDRCKAHVGCHPGTSEPLGFAADARTRKARSKLHEAMLDPIWRKAPRRERRKVRTAVYAFLSAKMDLPPDETHTGMWTVEQCHEAWLALEGQTARSVLAAYNGARR